MDFGFYLYIDINLLFVISPTHHLIGNDLIVILTNACSHAIILVYVMHHYRFITHGFCPIGVFCKSSELELRDDGGWGDLRREIEISKLGIRFDWWKEIN